MLYHGAKGVHEDPHTGLHLCQHRTDSDNIRATHNLVYRLEYRAQGINKDSQKAVQ